MRKRKLKRILTGILIATITITSVPSITYAANEPEGIESVSFQDNAAAETKNFEPKNNVDSESEAKYSYENSMGQTETEECMLKEDGADDTEDENAENAESDIMEEIKTESAIETETTELTNTKASDADSIFTERAVIASGKCGDNLTWTLEEGGILTISGTGDMWNYTDIGNPAPWREYVGSSFTKLVIQNGVTSIGNYAFYYCYEPFVVGSLEELEIPNSVTRIGENAFENCYGFTGSLIIPENVMSIEKEAFKSCKGLTGELKLPDGLINIDDSAFSDCGFTGSLILPENLTSIGPTAFWQCSGFTGDLIIPKNVKSIPFRAFGRCSGFKGNLVMLGDVTNIGREAFSGCHFTGNLTIPESVTDIGSFAFEWCGNFTGNLTIPSGVTNIESWAFSNCSGFTGNLTIPDNVISIGKYAFYNCRGFSGNLIVPDSVISIENYAFSHCSNIKNIIFEGNAPTIEDEPFTDIIANAYYLRTATGWKDCTKEQYGGELIWIPYDEGTEPWNIDADETAPQIYLLTTSTPQQLTYRNEGLDATEISMNMSALHMNFAIDDPVVYENAVINIELPEGLSFDKNSQQQTLSKPIGTLDNMETKRVDLETITIYVNPDQISEQYDILFEVRCDNYEKTQKSTYIIPVNFEISKLDEDIVNAVKKYTSQEESEVLQRIFSTYSGDELIQKLYEFYNCDNAFDLRDKITEWKDSYNERWSYTGLTSDEMYCSWQYYNYLNNTPKGIAARASLYASGLVFNGELGTWLDPGTYMDGDYPGISKYKALLENFIDRQNTSVPHYSYIKETQKFVKGAVGLCTDVEKTELLKELDKSTDLVEAQSIFNNFIATKLPDSKKGEITIVYEDKTLFSEAMGCTGKVFKIVNATVDGIASFVDVSGNLDTYETYKNFLHDIYESQDLPWELRIAAYQLIDEFTKEYYAPFENILKQLRDTCFDKALDATKMGSVLNLNGYLTTLDFTAFCINKFVDIGSLVENSAYTEGYAILAMHYEDKLKACKSRFLADETEQNAWEFYESYLMLWKLRVEGEKQWLEMNKLGGILGGIISESCSYSDKETTVNENLKLLKSFQFKYDINNGTIPKDYQYLQKVVVECPVTVDIYASDGAVICTLPDREEAEIVNEYGRFITKYRPTTGDYVKIGYLYRRDSYTVNMTGQNSGSVECSIVTTEDHQNYTIKGFDKIQIDDGTVISIETEREEYTVDQDGDGTAEIKAEIIDKERLYVQFIDQNGQNITTIYANDKGYISMPKPAVQNGYVFEGWYTKPNGEGEFFDGSTAIKSGITVYANWRKTDSYKVTFNVMGHGTAPAPYMEIDAGSTIEEPVPPFASGYIFTGWYKDETCKNKWDFATDTVIEDIVLYAGWIAESTSDQNMGEILPEDRPLSGEIPDGIWIAGIQNKPYTSNAVTQSLRVYDGNKLLKEKTDYTISYKNNIKAYTLNDTENPSTDDRKKAPQVIIKTKGNYAGNQTVYFNITKPDINDASAFAAADLTVQYNKKKNTPAPTLTWNGKKLKQGKDFYVKEYETEKRNSHAFVGKETENTTYILTLIGKGNFTGERKITLTVFGTWVTIGSTSFPQILLSKVNVSKIPNQPYTGKAITWNQLKQNVGEKFKVSYRNKVLVEHIDYEIVDIINNDKIGSATLVLRGLQGIEGETGYSFVGDKKVTFKITGASINKAKIYNLEKSYTYTGTEIRPSVKLKDIGANNYTVEYLNNINAGKATIIITGVNACTGTKKVTFKITGCPINRSDIKINNGIEKGLTAVYRKGGAKPEITVSYGNQRLQEGRDYTLKYKNNMKIANASDAKAPTVTILGKGNFSGSRTVKYSITMADITQGITILADDVVENTKANKYKAKLTLKDADGKTLKAGIDYDQTSIRYYVTENGVERELNSLDRPLAGTVITVKVKGKGNYGTGEISTTYRILAANKNIAKGTFKIKDQPYTGQPIKITKQEQFKVDKNGNVQAYIKIGKQYTYLTLGKDFEIVENSYTKNTTKGKATVMLHGIGEYGGYKTVNFNVGTRSINDWWKGLFGK